MSSERRVRRNENSYKTLNEARISFALLFPWIGYLSKMSALFHMTRTRMDRVLAWSVSDVGEDSDLSRPFLAVTKSARLF